MPEDAIGVSDLLPAFDRLPGYSSLARGHDTRTEPGWCLATGNPDAYGRRVLCCRPATGPGEAEVR